MGGSDVEVGCRWRRVWAGVAYRGLAGCSVASSGGNARGSQAGSGQHVCDWLCRARGSRVGGGACRTTEVDVAAAQDLGSALTNLTRTASDWPKPDLAASQQRANLNSSY